MQNNLEFREKLNFETDFLRNTSLSKIIVFDLYAAFFDGFNMFFRFLAEMRLRIIIKSHQKNKFSTQNVKFCTTCTLP